MAIEKSWSKVGPLVLSANGDKEGTVIVPSTANLYVKQKIFILSDTVQLLNLEIKSVLSKTTLKVGPKSSSMTDYTDLTSVLVTDNAVLRADDQPRSKIPEIEFERAVFAEEPIVAKRVIPVDPWGNYYTTENPFTVQLSDGSINIDTVNANLEVQLTDKESEPGEKDYDIIRIGDGEDELEINPDGSINATISSVKTPLVQNVDLPLANTEYSIPLSVRAKRFKLRIRNHTAEAKISYVESDSGINYWTIPRGNSYEELNINNTEQLTIYIQTNRPDQVVELMYWE